MAVSTRLEPAAGIVPETGKEAMLIRNVRPWGGAAHDVVITGDVISEVREHDAAAPLATGDIDGRGRLLLPSFSDVHVHLDSTRMGLPFRPHTGAPGV